MSENEAAPAERDAAVQALEQLMARVDLALSNNLTAEELEELTAHLKQCAACADEIECVRLLRQLLQDSCERRAPQSLREKVAIVSREYRSTNGRISYSSMRVSVHRDVTGEG